jgi:hypothetical protein
VLTRDRRQRNYLRDLPTRSPAFRSLRAHRKPAHDHRRGQSSAACWTIIACGFADARLDVGVQIPEPCPAPRSWSGRSPCDGSACRLGRTRARRRRASCQHTGRLPAASRWQATAPPVLVRATAGRRVVVVEGVLAPATACHHGLERASTEPDGSRLVSPASLVLSNCGRDLWAVQDLNL